MTPWTCAGSAGPHPAAARPEDADVDMPIADHMALSLSGRVLPAEDRRVLAAFGAQAAVVRDRRRLQEEADRSRALSEGNRIRTALLAAVSHGLRTPLAGIKAAVTSLRSDDVEWSEADQAELLAAIEAGADRLDHLVDHLLDMSRLQTGTVAPLICEVDLDDRSPRACPRSTTSWRRSERPRLPPSRSWTRQTPPNPPRPTPEDADLLDGLPYLALNLVQAPEQLLRRLFEVIQLTVHLHHDPAEATISITLPVDMLPDIVRTAEMMQDPMPAMPKPQVRRGAATHRIHTDAVGAPGGAPTRYTR